jgi:hypothetical protein
MDRAPEEVFNQTGELNGCRLFSTHSAATDHEALLRHCCTAPAP